MKPEKRDHLKLCNDMGVPMEDFKAQFCDRCLQAECTRSQHGKSRFEERTQNWQERLFLETPKMQVSDPRYSVLRARNFIDVDTGPVPEVGRSGWVDPLQTPTPKRSLPVLPNIEADLTPVANVPSVQADPEEAPDTDRNPEPLPPAPPATTGPQVQKNTGNPLNTPNRAGIMIGGPAKAPAPKDPWQGKTESTPAGNVVKPGAKIRLGSGV